MGLNYYQIKKNILRARKLVIKATNTAGSGHPGGSFSMAEILGCLFNKHLKFDAQNPQWEDRDRLVLSKGHAAPGLFSNMAVAGYFPESEIETLRKFGSRLQGHPDLKCPGVEFCGGSLGTGLSYSVGIALAAKIDSKDHHVYTIIGDGESDEGQVWEAAMTASKYKVDNLTAFLDRNFIQQDSYTEKIMPLDEKLEGDDITEMWKDASRWKTGDKWRSFGWNVLEIDGHRVEQIDAAITKANATKGVPTIIISRTIKGKSLEHMEDNPQWHGKAPDSDVVPIINSELDSQFLIAPSIIAGDMSNLENEVKRCVTGRSDLIHLDVMDGQFVPTKTFDHNKIKELRPLTVIPFDTHLMINEPVKHVKDYIDAGSDIVTVHAEVTDESSFGEIHDILKQNQVGVGFAINPDTELPEWSHKFLSTLDQLIVMSVVPGKSGQKYIEETHDKMARLNSTLNEHNFSGCIEADGGVNIENIGSVFLDGARAFVGGGAIVGQQDVRAAIKDFRNAVLKSRRRMLLDKANQLGGSDLVNKWIGLHVIGAKQEEIKKNCTGVWIPLNEPVMTDMRSEYSKSLIQVGHDNPNVVVLGADTTDSLKTSGFGKQFPARFFNVGIAEANLVTVSAGLAVSGKISFASTYAIFLPGRAVDQIRNNIAYPSPPGKKGLNVKLVTSHGGLSVGPDGGSHQQIEDIAIMRVIPNFRVFIPADTISVSKLTQLMASEYGPFYMRMARSKTPIVHSESQEFKIGKGITVRDGSDCTIAACGITVRMALEAAEMLQQDGISCRVLDMFSIKPIDNEILEKAARETGCIVTTEEHNIFGGMGSAVAESVSGSYPVPIKRIGAQDMFGESARDAEIPLLLEKHGITSFNMAKQAKELRSKKT